jgi:DNA repair protein RecO
MGRTHSHSTTALILKQKSYKERDVLITLLTESHGKIVAVAKGTKSLTSSKAGALESGNVATVHLITTNSMPILTQAKVISTCAEIRTQLPKLRQLFQFLEMINVLFTEDEAEDELFAEVLALRNLLAAPGPTPGEFKVRLEQLIAALGYQHPTETKYSTLTEYVSVLADKPLKAWEYLKI